MVRAKTLFLVRHAKSSWKGPTLSDHARPLNKRGKRDVVLMGKRLVGLLESPELIVCSSATRAAVTARAIADAYEYSHDKIVFDDAIYGASMKRLIDLVRSFTERCDRVMLVGHNPGITEAFNCLSKLEVSNIPTCGVAVLHFDSDSWSDIAEGKGKIAHYDYPKRISN